MDVMSMWSGTDVPLWMVEGGRLDQAVPAIIPKMGMHSAVMSNITQ